MKNWNFRNEWMVELKDIETEMPYRVIEEKMFTPEECDEFIKEIKENGHYEKGSTYGNMLDNEKYSNRIVDVWNSMDQRIRKKIHKAVSDINNDVWNFDLDETGIEPLQLCVYNSGNRSHYTWHKDSSWLGSKDIMRKLSFSILLTPSSSFKGGELELFTGLSPNGRPLMLESGLRNKGDICVFPSDVYHRVKPMQAGTRIALVGWIWGKRIT